MLKGVFPLLGVPTLTFVPCCPAVVPVWSHARNVTVAVPPFFPSG